MSPGSRCDEVIRLIDEALGEPTPEAVEAVEADDSSAEPVEPEDPDAPAVEEIPGHWGVYYLRPTA